MGDLDIIPSSSPQPAAVPRETPMSAAWEVLVLQVQEMSGDDGALLGAVRIEVDGAIPRPGNDARGSLWDSVMHGASIGAPRSAALGDVTTTPESSGVTDLVGSRLLLPGSLSFPPLPIDWRRVEDNVEFACSHVAIVEWLLHEMLALVGRNILNPIRVSLTTERNV
jgi:hypothetical protein